jgi:hypothetical protein
MGKVKMEHSRSVLQIYKYDLTKKIQLGQLVDIKDSNKHIYCAQKVQILTISQQIFKFLHLPHLNWKMRPGNLILPVGFN